MNSSVTTGFSKQLTCPSSETLLKYHQTSPATKHQAWISTHLAACDFCGAELQLLSRYPPPEDEDCTLTDIPLGLRRLAESLLRGGSLQLETLAETACAKEPLTLTDA